MSLDESDLPKVVQRYLDDRKLSAVPTGELEQLRQRPAYTPPTCPYPIFLEGWGPSHRRYLGQICMKDDDPLTGLIVMRCEACGNIEFNEPVIFASTSPTEKSGDSNEHV